MTKEVIIKELSQRHINFVNYILSLSYKEFMFSFQDNWTAGQQMDHIYRATVFLPLAFQMPEFIIGFIFGKPKNAPMGYDELVQQYLLQLEKGARAPHLFKPAKIPYSYRIDLADKTVKNISKINIAINIVFNQWNIIVLQQSYGFLLVFVWHQAAKRIIKITYKQAGSQFGLLQYFFKRFHIHACLRTGGQLQDGQPQALCQLQDAVKAGAFYCNGITAFGKRHQAIGNRGDATRGGHYLIFSEIAFPCKRPLGYLRS